MTEEVETTEYRSLRAENEVLKRLLTNANRELEGFYKVAKALPILEQINQFLAQVAAERRPLITQLVARSPEGEETPVVSLWAAYGEGNPIDRLKEVAGAVSATLEENRHLADGEVCTLWRLKKVMEPPPTVR